MTEPATGPDTALGVALTYHEAWTSHDVDAAMRLVADDIVCDAPSGQLRGVGAYRPFIANFAPLASGYDMIAAISEGETAILVYDLHTAPVPSGLVCECFTVRDGKIARNRLIFDQTPYLEARRQAS